MMPTRSMTRSELSTAIAEAILRKLEQTRGLRWKDAEDREVAKLEVIWACEPLLWFLPCPEHTDV